MTVGLVGTALLLRHVGGNEAAWAITAPLLVAGLGGGLVTSPNLTLTCSTSPCGCRRSGRRPANRPAHRRGDRHSRTGHDLLPGARPYRPWLPDSGLRHPAVRFRAHGAGAADDPRGGDARALPPPQRRGTGPRDPNTRPPPDL